MSRPDDWYLETLYVVMGGSSDGYFDVLGAHGAGFASAPETDPGDVAANPNLGGHRSMCFRRVEDLRAIMVKYGDSNKQIALLEFGWTSDPRPDSPYNWHAVSEQTKADYMVRAYKYAQTNWSPWDRPDEPHLHLRPRLDPRPRAVLVGHLRSRLARVPAATLPIPRSRTCPSNTKAPTMWGPL